MRPMMQLTSALAFFVMALHAADQKSSEAQAKAKQAWFNAWSASKKKQAEKEGALVLQLHEKIVAADQQISEAEMKAYTNTVTIRMHYDPYRRTGLDHTVSVFSVMVPIKGGEFLMGSSETEADRRPEEGPPHRVQVASFWMQQCEVTWDEYEPFMLNLEERPNKTNIKDTTGGANQLSDAVSKPSKPYFDMSFGMGKKGYPAIAMTQHAASKYCEWLSAKTGHFYRLPTEAEWEYACRAGTTNAYSFGDNRAKLADYAWFYDNSYSKYQRVGKKKPNPWGLYDMHGNVAEWCLDQYDADFYLQQKDSLSVNPWNKAGRPYPHVIRGGSWDDDPEQLRSAARGKSDKSWKTDPSLPPTIWYMERAQFVGFRVVRPLKVPTAEEMYHYWNSGVENEMPIKW
jgi:formylglycine-generating enzyme required for sulfatase activity